MTVVRAHFDGKVFVPDEPTELRPGSVTLQVFELDRNGEASDPSALPFNMDTHPLTALPVVPVPHGTKKITNVDVQRALNEDN